MAPRNTWINIFPLTISFTVMATVTISYFLFVNIPAGDILRRESLLFGVVCLGNERKVFVFCVQVFR